MPLATPASQRCPLAEVWDSSTQLPTAHRSRPEPILPDEDDDYADREPEPLTPAQMRFGATNQEHRPLSTPGFEVPSYINTPNTEHVVHEIEANAYAATAPPVLPRINITSTPQRYEAYNPNVDMQRRPVASRLD
ncbi:hypothetical protein IAQ61_009827 [Plenodomus lingam]|uniref:uncharacterized protein n=1 Tax=Leptosphaeria maculans TaxID=5022 RepID=UPI003325639C|nr:hypothetical protein IAQ61_009827 [Plenodomus lingam]